MASQTQPSHQGRSSPCRYTRTEWGSLCSQWSLKTNHHNPKQYLRQSLPIWDWGTMVFFLSQRGENSSPCSCSMSPCLKNSSMHLEVHWWCKSHLLAGWETSQEWRSKLSTRCLSKLYKEGGWQKMQKTKYQVIPSSIYWTLHQVLHLLQLWEMHGHVWNGRTVWWRGQHGQVTSPVCRTISITRLRHSLKSVLDMLFRMLHSFSIMVLKWKYK